MDPTRIYVKPLLALLAKHDIHAMAHVTGGALVEDHPRGAAALRAGDRHLGLLPPPVFDWLQREGAVAREEMWRTFNCGVGFVLAVDPAAAPAIEADLAHMALPHWRIGQVVDAGDGERLKIG